MNRFCIFILTSFICYCSSAFGNIDTVKTIKYGNWNDPTIWSTGIVPGDSDYIIISTNVILNVNVKLPPPASIYITPTGDLCGPHDLDCMFTVYGSLSVKALYVEGKSVCYAYITALDSIYISGIGTSFYNYGGICVGCPLVCSPIAPPLASFTSATTICAGQSIAFTDKSTNAPTYWSWTFPGGTPSSSTQQNPVITYYTAGIYNVTLIAGNTIGADTLTMNAYINVNTNPTITLCCDTAISYGQSTQLVSSGGGTYSWVPANGLSCTNCPDPICQPSVTTTYTLTIKTDSGCSASSQVFVEVVCGNVFIPEAFSPNGDGQNDILYVRGDCIKQLDFMVFDRWGNKVFETQKQDVGWDGNYINKPLNAGSYAYSLSATMNDNTQLTKKGSVVLVR